MIKPELIRLALWLLLALVIGWPLGVAGWALALVALAYCGYYSYHLWRLLRWLRLEADDAKEPPEAKGVWGDIYDQIYHWQRRNRTARERLSAQINYIQESFMSLPYGVVMLDPDANIEWCNVAAEQLFGLRQPEDQGQQLLNLVRDPSFVEYFEAEQYKRPLEFESPYNRRIYLQVHVSFFGQRSRLLFARDITQTRKLEQMRKDFVANVSHELRTPLTVINGYLETFADSLEGTSPRWKRAVEQMLAQSKRMQNLVNDLILLSRLETVPQDSQQDRLELLPMLKAIREEALASVTTSREITIECDETLSLVGHRDELRSAFANIIYNAAKYTEPGGSIQIRWFADSDGAYLQVEDDGIGIEAEHIPRLTERFYRVDNSRSIETGGTGLGLAIVKHVLLRHQAKLEVTSTPGKGTCFTCVFPLMRTIRQSLVAEQ